MGLSIAALVLAAVRRQRRWKSDSATTANYFDAIQRPVLRPKTKGSGLLVAGAIVFAILGLFVAGPLGAIVVVVIAIVMGVSRSAENTRASANVQAEILAELRHSRERAERAEAALRASEIAGRQEASGTPSQPNPKE